MVSFWDRFIEQYGIEGYVKYRYLHESKPCLDLDCAPCGDFTERLLADTGWMP